MAAKLFVHPSTLPDSAYVSSKKDYSESKGFQSHDIVLQSYSSMNDSKLSVFPFKHR